MTRALPFLAPEIVQTSATDCGPACLAAFLSGHGIRASYGELRDLCATDVDGTSIDVMEDLSHALGLEAEQAVIPHELVLEDDRNRGAIAVAWTPGGQLHFIVLWNRIGPWIQVMDPSRGRVFMSKSEVLSLLYRHEISLPAADWREWAERALLKPLERVLIRIVSRERAGALIERALRDPTWRTLAALDASVRTVEHLLELGALEAREAGGCLEGLFPRAVEEADAERTIVPERWWSVSRASSVGEELSYRGAVLLRAIGRTAKTAAAEQLEAGSEEKRADPTSFLVRLLARGNERRLLLLAGIVAVVALGMAFQTVLFRASMDLIEQLAPDLHRATALAALLAFLLPLVAIQVPLELGLLRLGRHAEIRLRAMFSSALPRIDDRYFQTRLMPDMASRAHAIHSIRDLPGVLAKTLAASLELTLVCAGIRVLLPGSGVWIAASIFTTIAWPLLTLPLLRQADLRLLTHGGALTRFLLDALIGLAPIRVHGGERALLIEQEALLVEWSRASLSLCRAVLVAEAIRTVLSHALLIWILLAIASHPDLLGGSLLLIYWAVRVPLLGEQLVHSIRCYPVQLNRVQRCLETISSAPPAVEAEERTLKLSLAPGVELRLERVSVSAGGRQLLDELDLFIAAGEHVGIVGRSGAGKSSLVGLFLGWHRPSSGVIRADGRELDGEELEALRDETAWVDPTVQLWNRSLLDNLTFGQSRDRPLDVAAAVESSELHGVLDALERGYATSLGESGARLSGGQGQRVRLARAMLKRAPRLVILDEPFRGLERSARERSIREARRWWSKATMLCVTHDVQDTLQLDRVLVIEDGRIVEDGPPSELVNEAGSRYRHLLLTEVSVRRELWSNPLWRRLRLDGGALFEEARPASVETSDLTAIEQAS